MQSNLWVTHVCFIDCQVHMNNSQMVEVLLVSSVVE